jgi:hypothetical protein
MKKQFKIIETKNYILAVSEKEIKEGYVYNYFNDGIYYLTFKTTDRQLLSKPNILVIEDIKAFPENYVQIIAYKPKNNAPELDLPLLPEIVVEDDVEKLAKESNLKREFPSRGYGEDEFIAGYKAATKVYSEEDLRKAIELSRVTYQDKSFGKTMFKYKPGEVIQLTKDSKTPEWFVAEMEQVILKDPNSCEHYIEVGCIEDICTCYTFRLKTTTINNKTYLVGHYE